MKHRYPNTAKLSAHAWMDVDLSLEAKYTCPEMQTMGDEWKYAPVDSAEEDKLAAEMLEHFERCDECRAGLVAWKLSR